MAKKPTTPSKPKPTLRERAEPAVCASTTDITRLSLEEVQRQIHELQVHQIELEMQNDELRRAQTELAESRDRFNHLYDFAPVGYVTLDRTGTMLEANLTLAAMLGLERDKLVVGKFTSFVAPEAQDALNRHQRAVLGSDVKQACNLDLRRADGTTFTAQMETTSFLDAVSGGWHSLSAISDITERRATELALRESNARYELVMAGANDAIWDWDVVNHRVLFSPRWKSLRGYGPDEVGDSEEEWSAGIHPEDAPRVFAAVQAHFAGETAHFAEEYRVRHKDGSWLWVLDRGLAKRDATGRVVRMAGSEKDITERKHAQLALARSEERLKVAAEAGRIGIWEWNVKTGELIWDAAMFSLYGARREDFSGAYDAWSSRLHPEDKAATEAALLDALAGRREYTPEFRVVWPDGSEHWIGGRARVIRDEAGELVRMVGPNTDLTESKSRERNLTFLEQFQLALSPVASLAEVMQVACARIAAHLQLSHCALVETNEDADECAVLWDANAPGTSNLAGNYRLCNFHPPEEREFLRTGGSLVVEDVRENERSAARVEHFEALSIRSLVNAPYLADGRWKFVLHCSRSQPSRWVTGDLELVTALTARVYLRLQRARAEEAVRVSDVRAQPVFQANAGRHLLQRVAPAGRVE